MSSRKERGILHKNIKFSLDKMGWRATLLAQLDSEKTDFLAGITRSKTYIKNDLQQLLHMETI